MQHHDEITFFPPKNLCLRLKKYTTITQHSESEQNKCWYFSADSLEEQRCNGTAHNTKECTDRSILYEYQWQNNCA